MDAKQLRRKKKEASFRAWGWHLLMSDAKERGRGEKETEKILDADSAPPPPLTHPDLTNRSLGTKGMSIARYMRAYTLQRRAKHTDVC